MKIFNQGCLGGSAVEWLPSAQVMIPGSWDLVPCQALHREPASPSFYVSASLCVSHEHINKIFKRERRGRETRAISLSCEYTAIR